MQNSIRAALISVSLFFVAACGGGASQDTSCDDSATCGAEASDAGDAQQVQTEALCCWCATPPPGCTEEQDPPPPPPPPSMTLTVRLRNASSTTRECSDVTVATTNEHNMFVTQTIAPGGITDAGGEIVGTISFPQGTAVSANGGCWRLGYPTYDYVNGSFPITMTTNKDCTLIYSVSGDYASERMECVSY